MKLGLAGLVFSINLFVGCAPRQLLGYEIPKYDSETPIAVKNESSKDYQISTITIKLENKQKYEGFLNNNKLD